ncbi:MAG: hypothetical protein JOZ56_08770 [Actinobacteria bacterium]|nr:hypothetical protein [Actinomycetota bacterium]MBV8563169.1 hypothetical protein [Actinomycetota bacterium]
MDAGRLASLFREVNDRIADLAGGDGWNAESDYLCECGADCGGRVTLDPASYEALRRLGKPVLAPACVRAPARRPLAA